MTYRTGRDNFASRFLEKCLSVGGPNCWEWGATKNDHGYGRLRVMGKLTLASRALWEHLRGPIPADLCVLHSCDNPGCVNPGHLFLGTHKENMEDRAQKGRCAIPAPRLKETGEHMNAKLTREQVLAIKQALGKRSDQELGREFGVCRASIQNIRRGFTWKSLS